MPTPLLRVVFGMCQNLNEELEHRRAMDPCLPELASSVDLASRDLNSIIFPLPIRKRLLDAVNKRLPHKSFGYLLSKGDPKTIDDFVLFEANTRNSAIWKGQFESYGQYFREHDDAGFVSTPEETWRVQKLIAAKGLTEIGLFHSHSRHPANFSQIDYDMHTECHSHLFHMIISVRNPNLPQVRVFYISGGSVHEANVLPSPTWNDDSDGERLDDEVISQGLTGAERLLAVDRSGRPHCTDSRAMFFAIQSLLRAPNSKACRHLLIDGFLAGSADRYEKFIAPNMQRLEAATFQMGTDASRLRHFVGEYPQHEVALSPFKISRVIVTNRLFGLFRSRGHGTTSEEYSRMPASNLTWYDAVIFAMWMGCRLPSEAEWEFACGSTSTGEWACNDESNLPRMAWYSENSKGKIQPVATKDPNDFGLFDLHGNVWEWCQDSYHQNYYSISDCLDPPNRRPSSADKVCRGGSVNALAEMCRTRYRFHEPPDFHAEDLGIRLVS
jgi:formylglycine-generating enzyme required for sulfatase activity